MMLLSRLRAVRTALAVLRRLLPAGAAAGALLALVAPSGARAQSATAADIAPANLNGKTITLNAVVAGAPFQGTGIFTISFTGTTYTMPIAQGNPALFSGSYTAVSQSGTTLIRLSGYLVGGSPVQLVLVPQAAALIPGAFEMFADGVAAAKTGTFTVSGGSGGGGGGGGGGTSGAPAITSATTATATVGVPFTYAITTSPAATSFTNTGGNAPVAISPGSGLVTGTFTTAGTFTFSFTALNAAGASPVTTVTVTVAGSSTGGTGGVAAFAGTYTGNVLQRLGGITAILGSANYSTVIAATGGVVTTVTNAGSSSTLVGTIASNGTITYTSGTALPIYRITAASVLVASSRPVFGSAFFVASTSSTGATTEYSFQSSGTFVAGTGGNPAANAPAAPVNLVGYRNKVGQVFQFTVTGAARGAVWGTDVYTDDSTVAAAAVHAGVLAAGATGTVTVTILGGQSSYPASTRNGVSAASWGSWPGSYSFAGAGTVSSAANPDVAAARPAAAPGFTAGTAALAAGGRLVCPVVVTGGGSYTYQWYLNGARIAGATANPYIVESLTAANAGTYSVDVANALGTTRIVAGTVTVGAVGSPVLTLQPIAKNVVPGGTFTVAAAATGSGLTYQWLRNGTALPGETGAILLRQNVTAADAGNYSVRIANATGSVTSNAATITLSADASRPANISVRTNVATGATVIPGFVLQGTGTKRVLIRAVGPGLAAFGLTGTMADPTFAVFQGSTKVAENNDWSAANIGNAFAATGAFALPAGSRDSALVTDLAAGRDYTVQVTNASGSGGIVLIEVYDADVLAGRSTSKLVNVSVRGQTAPGDDVLTLGLVIGGTGPRTLLVRGIGPKLAAFGVTGTVADPRLQIFDSQQRAILANDDWAGADFVGELVLATTYVGAFALDNGSRDAATLSLVQPGAYTIQVSGAASAPTGEALVEVYEVP